VKVVLVSKDKEHLTALTYHFAPLAFDIMHIQEPSQLVDSIKRESYDLVLFDTRDYPRHWKPIVKLIREYYTKEQTVFILLVSNEYRFEEACKAIFLGVNGLVNIDLSDKHEIVRLEEIFKRYHMVSEKRRFNRIVPDTNDTFNLLFTEPRSFSLIPGMIMDISVQGAMFKPFPTPSLKRIKKDDIIPFCSLHIGSYLVSLECKITRITDTIGVEFTSFNNDAHHKLFKYLMERSERQLKQSIAHNTN
jgi:hypothetical protein